MAQPEIPGTDLGKVVMPYGSDGSNWIALLVDLLGRLQVDATIDNLPSDLATQTTLAALLTELGLKADLTETQPISAASLPLPTDAATQTTLADCLTSLQKIDDILSFDSIVEESLGSDTLAAGVNTFNGTPVGTGKVWKITHISMWYTGTVPTLVYGSVMGLATELTLIHPSTIVSGQTYFWDGEVYMQEGDYIKLYISGATLNDDCWLRYVGLQLNPP